jgi:DNA-binding CsgD family transcriptional regulator
MQQIVLLYLFLCLLVGVPALVMTVILYHQHRKSELLYYAGIFVCMTVQVFTNLNAFYQSILDTHLNTFSLVGILIAAPFSTIMYFLMMLFFHRLLKVPYEQAARPFIIAVGIVVTMLILSPLSIQFDFVRSTITMRPGNIVIGVISTVISLYCLVLPLIFWKRIADKAVKRYLVQFLVVAGLCLPGIIRDAFYFSTSADITSLPSVIIFFPFFYLFWAAGTLFYSIRYIIGSLKGHPRGSFSPADLEKFFTKHDLTAREREIVALLVEGLGNKQIADRLTISVRTVSNHLYNIYQKLAVSTRFELLALLQKDLSS